MNKVLETIQNWSHVIELDNEDLPTDDNKIWNKGYTRFYDPLTGAMISVNENTGKISLWVANYTKNIKIPKSNSQIFRK